MLTIAGIILFTLLWGVALSGLFETFGPLRRQIIKSFSTLKSAKTHTNYHHRPQF